MSEMFMENADVSVATVPCALSGLCIKCGLQDITVSYVFRCSLFSFRNDCVDCIWDGKMCVLLYRTFIL